jgi:hypothetical protein
VFYSGRARATEGNNNNKKRGKKTKKEKAGIDRRNPVLLIRGRKAKPH